MSQDSQQQSSTEVTVVPQKREISANSRGLEFQTMDEMYRFAKAVSASGMAPQGVESPESIFVALQMGAELGLKPMASIQNIAVINGRPSVWGDAMLAICRGSSVFNHEVYAEWFEGDPGTDGWTAKCRCGRIGTDTLVTGEFSVADAKRAGLWGKAGPWKQYPKRMLQLRARSFALRDAFTDLLSGIVAAEEAQDIAIHKQQRAMNAPSEKAQALQARLDKAATSTPAKEAEPETSPEPAPTKQAQSHHDPLWEHVGGDEPPEDEAPQEVNERDVGHPAEDTGGEEVEADDFVDHMLNEGSEILGCDPGELADRVDKFATKVRGYPLNEMSEEDCQDILARIKSGSFKL